jgi:hypothetical protein
LRQTLSSGHVCFSPGPKKREISGRSVVTGKPDFSCAGALPLFVTPTTEPTEADLRKMDLIDRELRKFAEKFERQVSKTRGSA